MSPVRRRREGTGGWGGGGLRFEARTVLQEGAGLDVEEGQHAHTRQRQGHHGGGAAGGVPQLVQGPAQRLVLEEDHERLEPHHPAGGTTP